MMSESKNSFIVKRFRTKKDRKNCWINYSGTTPQAYWRSNTKGKLDNYCLFCDRKLNKFRTFYGIGYKWQWSGEKPVTSTMIYKKNKKHIFYDAVHSEECATMYILSRI
jgi:hypothetical protein